MTQPARILIADDEPNICQVLATVLGREGHQVLVSHNGEHAMRVLKEQEVDLVITDVVMRKVSGIDLLHWLREHHPGVPVIMMTAYGTIKTAVDAIKMGAYDYLPKPFEVDQMKQVVARALEERCAQDETPTESKRQQAAKPTPPLDFGEICGSSPAWEDVLALTAKVARSRANVLIVGESGSGKEVIARAIHRNSDRRDRPFIAVSCASLSRDLLESELFGHEKGSFTGADYQKPGRFELADGGTLLLDEIGEVPLDLQVKLLRVLQERQFERVGGTKSLQVDVRVIAATNKDLEAAVAAGAFREDLYFRLNVVRITLPSLRERRQDIPEFVQHFLARYNAENGKQIQDIPPDTARLFQEHNWPGNVRELENAIEHAVVLADEGATELTLDLLPAGLRAAAKEAQEDTDRSDFRNLDDDARRQLLADALSRADGHLTEAAAALGLSPSSLRYYARKYRLTEGGSGRAPVKAGSDKGEVRR
jgi:DNA-binding NtrC family response regulator